MKENTEHLRGKEPKGKNWRNRHDIAQHLGISIRQVSNLQRRRVLPYIKIGRIVRFCIEDCDTALKAMEIASMAQLMAARRL